MTNPATSQPTIDLAGLSQAQHALGAVPPPIQLWDAAPTQPPAPLRVIGTPAQTAELNALNAPAPLASPITCHFLRNVTLLGSGYLMQGGSVVTDGSDLGDVAAEWVARPMPDSPLVVPPRVERWIEDPCIVAIAPGHRIYGHWLLDFIPRFMIAREALGRDFPKTKIVLPDDTPPWAIAMLEAFIGIERRQLVTFERGVDRLALRNACVPSYAHNRYAFHPFAQSVFAALGTRPMPGGPRRLCISRVGFERTTHGIHKVFQNREAFETMAEHHGYRVIRPETMPLRDQAAVFASASHVVGEYGSGLHTTLFSPAGLRCGMVRCPTAIQFRIAAMRRHHSTVVMPTDDRVAETGILEYTLTDAEMRAFFAANQD